MATTTIERTTVEVQITVCEASELRLPPGQYPLRIYPTEGDMTAWEFVRFEGDVAIYSRPLAGMRNVREWLHVLND